MLDKSFYKEYNTCTDEVLFKWLVNAKKNPIGKKGSTGGTMKKLMIAIMILVGLSLVSGQTDTRQRVSVQETNKNGKEMLVITYQTTPEFEAWFTVRKNPGDLKGYLVGPNKVGNIQKADIKSAWMYYNTSKLPCMISADGLTCEIEKPTKEKDYFFSWEVLTSTGQRGFSLVDRWSSFAYSPSLDPKGNRPNLEFRFQVNSSKGTIVPAGNIH